MGHNLNPQSYGLVSESDIPNRRRYERGVAYPLDRAPAGDGYYHHPEGYRWGIKSEALCSLPHICHKLPQQNCNQRLLKELCGKEFSPPTT